MASQFPEWIRRSWASGEGFRETKSILHDLGLHTVCQSAKCPNMGECWRKRTATFMILGNVCTRGCGFCAVNAGVPSTVDPEEPERVAEAVRRLDLRHAVVTSVTRDDLADGGAGHFARTVKAIRRLNGDTTVEVLVSDFAGRRESVLDVLAAEPDVFGHNIETVSRLYPKLRGPRHSYTRSLDVLRLASETVKNRTGRRAIVKSALMVGHGETEDEVRETLTDLRDAGCKVVYIGQYLRPGPKQCAVIEYVRPERFGFYETLAREMGFAYVAAGPFVRSSYRSNEALESVRGAETARPENTSLQGRVSHAV